MEEEFKKEIELAQKKALKYKELGCISLYNEIQAFISRLSSKNIIYDNANNYKLQHEVLSEIIGYNVTEGRKLHIQFDINKIEYINLIKWIGKTKQIKLENDKNILIFSNNTLEKFSIINEPIAEVVIYFEHKELFNKNYDYFYNSSATSTSYSWTTQAS
jgi:hypothetical protein